jgi:hypothetical protein
MSAITDLVNIIVDYASKNIKSVVIGMMLMPVFFYGTTALYKVDPKMHLDFLTGESPYIDRYELVATHLDKVNKEVQEFEILSHKKQSGLFKVLETNISDDIERAKALKTINRNQDIVRALMAFGKYHSVLVSSEQSDSKTQESLRKLYTGYLNIVKADDNPAFVQKAFRNFKEVYQEIDVFPMPLKNEIKIELLNYLTYLSFRQKNTSDSNLYSEVASDLLNSPENKNMDAITYRRNYYWVDLSQFMIAINKLDAAKADEFFQKLRKRLSDSPFLKAKLLQHSSRLDIDENKIFLKDYINRL